MSADVYMFERMHVHIVCRFPYLKVHQWSILLEYVRYVCVHTCDSVICIFTSVSADVYMFERMHEYIVCKFLYLKVHQWSILLD